MKTSQYSKGLDKEAAFWLLFIVKQFIIFYVQLYLKNENK